MLCATVCMVELTFQYWRQKVRCTFLHSEVRGFAFKLMKKYLQLAQIADKDIKCNFKLSSYSSDDQFV